MSAAHHDSHALLERLAVRLEHVFAAEDALEALAVARERSRTLAHATNDPAPGLAVLTLAVEALVELAVDRGLGEDVFAEVLEVTADAAGVSVDAWGLHVSRRAIGHPRLLSLPPYLALEAQLRLARAAPPLSEISLWRRGESGPECVVSVGEEEPSPTVRREARRVLSNGASPNGKGQVHAMRVMRWKEVYAVLVGRASRPDTEDRCQVVLEAAAAAVQPALEKEMLLSQSVERERSLLESTERRFSRFGFDLHDGAIQDIAALAEDVRVFRRQLSDPLDGSDYRDVILGRVDDLEARLITLDDDLRELARSFESPSFLKRPFRKVLERELAAFGRRTDVRATLDVRGDLGQLTASQRIALLRIVQEALANVREHSGASEVEVSVVASRGAVQASIRDNGRGFDVERRLLRAAGHGRLGLVGMSERVRLLGGAFDVQSAPGGPTRVSVTLPEWRPISGAQDEGVA